MVGRTWVGLLVAGWAWAEVEGSNVGGDAGVVEVEMVSRMWAEVQTWRRCRRLAERGGRCCG